MTVCSVVDCLRPRFGHGLCNTHYQRMRKNGTLELKQHRNRCTVSDCDALAFGHGLCVRHYTRQRRYGSTNDPRKPASERFWEKVDKSVGPAACWFWRAKRNRDGYGVFWFEGRSWMAHRWAFAQIKPFDEALSLDHLCRTPACVNPTHLEAVPIGTNVLRGYGVAARNARKTHCPAGHPYDETNTVVTKDGRACRVCRRTKSHQAYLRLRATAG